MTSFEQIPYTGQQAPTQNGKLILAAIPKIWHCRDIHKHIQTYRQIYVPVLMPWPTDPYGLPWYIYIYQMEAKNYPKNYKKYKFHYNEKTPH